MARLPKIARSTGTRTAPGFFLCARKERRTGRGGPFLALLLQDVSGEIGAKVFTEVEIADPQFEAGEFVAVQGRGNLFNAAARADPRQDPPRDSRRRLARISRGRLHPVVAAADRRDVAGAAGPPRERRGPARARRCSRRSSTRTRKSCASGRPRGRCITRIAAACSSTCSRSWTSRCSSPTRTARGAICVIAGALLHDIGKLQELHVRGRDRLLGRRQPHRAHRDRRRHAPRRRSAASPDFPPELAIELEHLILSHHGAKRTRLAGRADDDRGLHPRGDRRSRREDPSGAPPYRRR